MKDELESNLLGRLLDLAARKTTDMEPADSRVPVTNYLSPERLERELDTLFRDRPVVIDHAERVREPGSFVTHDVGRVPLLVLRDRTGTLRGFLNVCRHRGARLVLEEQGVLRGETLACPYHSWAYRHDGRLAHVPHADAFPSVRCEETALASIAVQERHGLVWALPRPGLAFDLDASLGPFADDLASLGLADHVVRAQMTVERNLNWKLAVELFLESYHVQRVHKCLDPRRFLDNVVALDLHGPHVRYATARRPLLAALEGTKSARLREVASLVYLFFPNTLMLVESDYVGLATYLPAGVDRTIARLMLLVPQDDDRPREYWDKNVEIFFKVHDEDFTVGESIQRGLRSGANEQLTFGRFEHALKRFQANVAEALGV